MKGSHVFLALVIATLTACAYGEADKDSADTGGREDWNDTSPPDYMDGDPCEWDWDPAYCTDTWPGSPPPIATGDTGVPTSGGSGYPVTGTGDTGASTTTGDTGTSGTQ